jgi:hypothetical protein
MMGFADADLDANQLSTGSKNSGSPAPDGLDGALVRLARETKTRVDTRADSACENSGCAAQARA